MLRDTQPQREQLETTWTMLTQSHGATADLLRALTDTITVSLALLRHVDELQGEVSELKERLLSEKN